MRVLIAGAGPTGLTCGVELARRGIEVVVVEKRGEASGFSRAVGILPESLDLLHASGVSDALLAEGIKFTHAKFYDVSELVADIPLKIPRVENSFLLGLAQDRTEFHLHEALKKYGGKVIYGCALNGFEQRNNQVFVDIAGKKDASLNKGFDYLIGADGIGSIVRAKLGFSFPGIVLAEDWSIADVDANDWTNPAALTICRLFDNQVVVAVPLEANRYRLISNRPDALDALPLPMDVQKVRRAATFKIQVRQVEQYSSGRVFLAGDAAHCHSPVGGRGMNLGMADAAELARRIFEDDTSGYSKSRHRIGKEVIQVSERARKIVTNPNPLVRTSVINGLKLIGKVPFLQRRFARQALSIRT